MQKSNPLFEVERFVRKRFRELSCPQVCSYFAGLPELERRKAKFGKEVLATLDEWMSVTGIRNRGTMANALKALTQLKLIEWKPGDNGHNSSKRRSGRVRRLLIDEINSTADPELICRFVPSQFEALVSRLKARPIFYRGRTIYPDWSIKSTGRIFNRGNILAKKPHHRKDRQNPSFSDYAKLNNEYLIECDWSQAEPTMLMDVLLKRCLISNSIPDMDIYSAVAKAMRISREEAKRLYPKITNGYTPIPDEFRKDRRLLEFFDAVYRYREELWDKGKPSSVKGRHVQTLTGREMLFPKGSRVHRGMVLAWQLQGTIADLFNEVLTLILDYDEQGRCRFVFQRFDSIIVAVKNGASFPLAEIMRQVPEKYGINLKVKEEKL